MVYCFVMLVFYAIASSACVHWTIDADMFGKLVDVVEAAGAPYTDEGREFADKATALFGSYAVG